MALLIDPGKMLFRETNVDVPGGLKQGAAYDLALYKELGQPERGVLVVKVISNFLFKDGANPDGSRLAWTGTEKTDFRNGFKNAIESVWGEKHRITTTSRTPAVKEVGVIFDIETHEDMSSFSHSHWNLTTTKVPAFTTSSIHVGGGGIFTNGKGTLDSQDLTPVNKGGPTLQRGAVHEFGHMISYRDEYPQANDNPHWTTDLASIMHSSETVHPRHYVFFAKWISDQFVTLGALARETITFRVNGTHDMINGHI